MRGVIASLVALVLLAGDATAQAPIVVVPSVLPAAESFQVVEAPPPPPSVAVVETPSHLVTPWSVILELGLGQAGNYGNMVPSGRFGTRPGLFPIPSARLDGVINPRVALGYDLAPLVPGELTLGWTAFTASGEAILLGYDPLASLFVPVMRGMRAKEDQSGAYIPDLVMRATPSGNAIVNSSVDFNLVDLAYTTTLVNGDPTAGFRPTLLGTLGARLGTYYAEDTATGYGYSQSASNRFTGAGPVLGLRAVLPKQFNPFVGVEGGALFGQTTQEFSEVDLYANHPYRCQQVIGNRTVEFISVEAGWGGRPSAQGRFNWSGGIRYTQYFGIGDLGNSHLDFQAVVGFLRLDFRF